MISVYKSDIPIRKLYHLMEFMHDAELFKIRCGEFMRFDSENSDQNYWRFIFNDEIVFLVGVSDLRSNQCTRNISCAILSVCWWDSFLESCHSTKEQYLRERREFEKHFNTYLGFTIQELGVPFCQGKDEDERTYQYSIWKAPNGLFLLQQSSYDPQFGHDINYWLQSYAGDIQPTTPFMDWLLKINKTVS